MLKSILDQSSDTRQQYFANEDEMDLEMTKVERAPLSRLKKGPSADHATPTTITTTTKIALQQQYFTGEDDEDDIIGMANDVLEPSRAPTPSKSLRSDSPPAPIA